MNELPTDAEIELLISHALIGIRRPVRFLAETGMHLERAISLEWSQVILHRREVRVTKTKTSSPRLVPPQPVRTRHAPGQPATPDLADNLHEFVG